MLVSDRMVDLSSKDSGPSKRGNKRARGGGGGGGSVVQGNAGDPSHSAELWAILES